MSADSAATSYRLFIANKNYSSWSLRPWVLMRALGIGFEEVLVPFVEGPSGASHDLYSAFSPTAKVPCLHHGDSVIWESLAIVEYLAERHPGVWPDDPVARAFARCAASEMHAGFGVLRERCPMNCGVRIQLDASASGALARDIERLNQLWSEGLARFGGPFLAGAKFSAVDAFFAPVAFRIQSYGLDLAPVAAAYAQRLLALEPMQAWQAAALQEPWRDAGHEEEARASGVWLADLRQPAS